MTQIPTSRNIIQIEEVQEKAAVSESTYNRMGAHLNHHAIKQYDSHTWNLNGRYSLFGVVPGPDGVMPILFDMTLIGYLMYNNTAGTSGTTTLDIHELTGGGTDAGTIFSTKPAVSSAASSDTYSMIRLDPAADLALPTGHTKALFSKTAFLAGSALRLDLDAAMQGGRNISFQLFFRPT